MAAIAIFRSGQTPQYFKSAHTPDFSSDPDVLVNPDISAVASVPIQYWKRSGDTIIEMTAQEKANVEAASLAARKAAADNFSVAMVIAMTALIKVINVRLAAGQKITNAEMVTALKAEIT